MTTIDTRTLAVDQLAPMLRAWAKGVYAGEAAVELLIAHRDWLQRHDFRERLVDAVDDGWGCDGTVVAMASVDWDGVEAFLDHTYSSSSEASILRLAATLAGAQTHVPLRDLTISLDDTNATLVLNALAHRFGWHERGVSDLVTGHFVTRGDTIQSTTAGGAA